MSGKDRAVVEGEFTGAPKIEAETKKVNRALADVKKNAGEGIAAGFNKSTAALQVFGAKADTVRGLLSPQALLGGFIGGAVVSTIGSVTDYLERASDAARALGEHTSGTARRAGMEYGALSKVTAQQARHSLQGADAGLDMVDAVQQLSYGGKGAADSLRDVEDVANALGHSDKDLAPLIASFQTLYGLNVNVGREMNTLIEKAQRLHTIGGAQAIMDSMAGLRGTFGQISHQSQASKDKVTALRAVAGKTMNPEEADALTSYAVNFVKSHATKIAMTPGMGKYGDIMDTKTNQPKDAVATLKKLAAWARTKGKSEDEVDFKVANGTMGPEFNVLRRLPFGEIEAEAGREKERRTPEAIARANAAYASSPEGQQKERERIRQQRELAAGKRVEPLRRAYEGVADYFKNDLLQGFVPRGHSLGVRQSTPEEMTTLLRKIADNTDPNKPTSAVQLTVKKKPPGNK